MESTAKGPAAGDSGPTSGREVEITLLAGPGGLQRAMESPLLAQAELQSRARTLANVYYDTADRALQGARVALRLRRVGGRHILTAKFPPDAAQGPFGRDETEARMPGEAPDIDLLGPEVAARIHQITGGATLGPVFATRFRRRIGVVETPQARIELAIDKGTIEAAGRREALEELELELKQGEEAALCDFAAALAAGAGLRLGTLAKGERGSLLARDATPDAVRASVPAFVADIVVDDFLAAVIDICLHQFAGNWAAIAAGGGADGVHQARVALRRLRVMLALFGKSLPAPEIQALRGEAKSLAAALGPARDWDVFIAMVEKGPLPLDSHDASFEALLGAARAKRNLAYEQARGLVSDPAATGFVLEARSFAARRGWRNALAGTDLPVLSESARDFAARTLARMHKRVTKRGKRLAKLSIDERHDWRIDLKKIRYAAEFFGPLFGSAAAQRRYVRAAGKLQDALGAFNDEAVAHGLLDALEADAEAPVARAVGVVLGWCGRGRVDADMVLKPAWERFASAKRFWE